MHFDTSGYIYKGGFQRQVISQIEANKNDLQASEASFYLLYWH